jgi:hypothetical protein
MVEITELIQVLLLVLRLSPANIIPPELHTHLVDEQKAHWRPQFKDIFSPHRHEQQKQQQEQL